MHAANLKSWPHGHNFHGGAEHGKRNTCRVMALGGWLMHCHMLRHVMSQSH